MSSLNNEYREVDFYEYCSKCRYFGFPEEVDPCCECLAEPINEESLKPVKFKDVDPYGVGIKYEKDISESEKKYLKAIKNRFKTE